MVVEFGVVVVLLRLLLVVSWFIVVVRLFCLCLVWCTLIVLFSFRLFYMCLVGISVLPYCGFVVYGFLGDGLCCFSFLWVCFTFSFADLALVIGLCGAGQMFVVVISCWFSVCWLFC